MPIEDDVQCTNNVDSLCHFTILCGVSALEGPIANTLEALGCHQHRTAPVTLLIDLPGGFALRTLETTEYVNRHVIVVTWNTCPEYLGDLWDHQPDVLLVGKDLGQELVNAIASAERGERYRSTPGKPSALTERQRKILNRVAHDWSNQQIAESLGVSEKTVRNNLAEILSQLTLADRLAAALYYWGRPDLLDKQADQ
jgi:DNA-binding NarL/FixJ family response regulator